MKRLFLRIKKAIARFFKKEEHDFCCDTCDSPICDCSAIYERREYDG